MKKEEWDARDERLNLAMEFAKSMLVNAKFNTHIVRMSLGMADELLELVDRRERVKITDRDAINSLETRVFSCTNKDCVGDMRYVWASYHIDHLESMTFKCDVCKEVKRVYA